MAGGVAAFARHVESDIKTTSLMGSTTVPISLKLEPELGPELELELN